MKKNLILLTFAFCLWTRLLYAQSASTYFETYGSPSTGQAIALFADSTLAIGGQWNASGYLRKIDSKGHTLLQVSFSGLIPGQSDIRQLITDHEGNLIAAGQTTIYPPGDTITRVFTVKTDADLNILHYKVYSGLEDDKSIFEPRLARLDTLIVLAATVEGVGWNFEDYALMGLSPNLDTLWRRSFNSCGNCGFERAIGFTNTSNGFAAYLQHPFTDSLTMYGFNTNGDILWKNRSALLTDYQWYDFIYMNGLLYASAVIITDIKPLIINSYADSDGSYTDQMAVNAALFAQKDLNRLKSTPEGSLLAIQQITQNGILGQYQESLVLRINPGTEQLLEQIIIPNSNLLGGTLAMNIVPMNGDGSAFAVSGTRLPDNRAFFFSRNAFNLPPFDINSDTSCAPAIIEIENQTPGAVTYEWTLNGNWFSSEANPAPLTITEGGMHDINMTAIFPSQGGTEYLIDSFIIHSLPEIWNECAFCDNKPDPQVRIKDESGTVVYTSPIVEDYPPVSMPVNFRMKNGVVYTIEIWDYDLFPPDDFFGAFVVPGNTLDSTLSLYHPDDTDTPLTISFTTVELPASPDTVRFTRTVFVSNVAIEQNTIPASAPTTANGQIVVSQVQGGVTPYSFKWSNGAVTQNLSGILPGAYTLTITDQLGCLSVFSFEVGVLVSAGQEERLKMAAILVPNPTPVSGNSILQIRHAPAAGLEILVTDALGKIVSVKSAPETGNVQMPENLPAGVYMVHLHDESHRPIMSLHWIVQ